VFRFVLQVTCVADGEADEAQIADFTLDWSLREPLYLQQPKHPLCKLRARLKNA
jgi:hypothetical protein